MKKRFKDEVKALAERYHNGKHAGQSVWFLVQFEALDSELEKADADLGLVASVLAAVETALDRLGD
jgi:hypothetical protein